MGMAYIRWYLVNPYVQTFQNMYGKGWYGVSKAELRAAAVDPHLKKEKERNCGVAKKKCGPNQNIASTKKQRWLITYEKTNNLKIVAASFFCNASYFC